jgi:hypothetical protein
MTPDPLSATVAWVRTNDYWNDVPGRQSMQFNYELVGRGFRIERVHILSDELWPFDQKLPTGGILEWLVEQRGRGIYVSLLRGSDLSKEPDLVRDFAIYGDRATGTQELDEQSHTVRFVLAFDEQTIRQSLDRWERLKLFSSSFVYRDRPCQRRRTEIQRARAVNTGFNVPVHLNTFWRKG